jgi:hypothetical protein
MPIEARWFVKAGLIYFVLTVAIGGALLIFEAVDVSVPYVIVIEHVHLGTVGWLMNMVIGIALWMLPLNRERFPETMGRYPRRAIPLCFVLVNGGLLLRLLIEPWYQLGGKPITAAMLLIIAAIAQVMGVCLFAAIAWQRVRAPNRPAPGVR